MKKEAMLWEKLPDVRVRCHLCAHECRIADTKFGICGVRQNLDGTLYTQVYGRAVAAHIDPIEKKPLYHFLPGSQSFSFAAMGCNFKCGFCQNWQISQASVRDGAAFSLLDLAPRRIVEEAKQRRCASISYTYTEPTIFFEYAFDTAVLAREAGIANVFVTNGFMTRQTLETIKPYLDAANVDLKSFREETYKKECRGRLQPVLDTIGAMKELGVWVEVTTLVVPGMNDAEEELDDIAAFIAGVDRDMPWHVSRFHPDFQVLDRSPTPVGTLRKAKEIGQARGLRYIYLGNVQEGVDTACYRCGNVVVARRYMGLERMEVRDGRCPACGSPIGGVWTERGGDDSSREIT